MCDLNLAGAVRWLQAKKIPDKNGLQWYDWLDKNSAGNPVRDPSRHGDETLRRFLEEVSEGLPDLILQSAEKRLKAIQQLEENLSAVPKAQALLRLLKLTKDHISFRQSFACLCHHATQAVRLKRMPEAPSDVEELLLAVDCEMVETEDNDNALARVCACNASGQILMDRLVKPDGVVVDARTAITGIELSDLQTLDFGLSDAQAELRKLISPHTVLVGHTVHRDLEALRMDALLIFDISLLYGIQNQPKRRPALAHLVEEVLQRPNFRGVDGKEVHDCREDVKATMDIALHRLRKSPAPATVFVSCPVAHQVSEELARKLYIHRIPQRDDAFGALTQIWAKLPEVSASIEGLQMVSTAMGNRGLRGAEVTFNSKEAAEKAFLALKAESVELDAVQRPQKMVGITFPDRKKARVCVRPLLPGIGLACLAAVSQDTAAAEGDAPTAKKWKGKGWPGWRRAAEEALANAPSKALPWKTLVQELVQRRQQQAGGNSKEATETAEILELHALASLPEEFLSDTDALVRLPA